MKNVFFIRTFQTIFNVGVKLLPWREPRIIKGAGCFANLPEDIIKSGCKSVLIVTDPGLSKLEMPKPLIEALEKANISYKLYDKTVPNPTTENVEEAFTLYKEGNCDCIVALGGGSSMDCAKGVGVRVAHPNKPLSKYGGVLKVLKKLPPFYAVPTTAGTGSECTLAAVITDTKNSRKYVIEDLNIIPQTAVLDPNLTVGLPPHITSTTGIDALSHALEAYIGNANTKYTKEKAEKAILLIRDNLLKVYENGKDFEARQNMQLAAYYAGCAFTRAFVGYVHAIAHALGGKYHLPHGLAIAVTMPYVLEAYGVKAHKKLASLADLIEITKPDQTIAEKANLFINWLKELNTKMQIPDKFAEIKEEDLDELIANAYKEAIPIYPVPYIFSKDEFRTVIHRMMVPGNTSNENPTSVEENKPTEESK